MADTEMDPQACLKRLLEAAWRGDDAEVTEAAGQLLKLILMDGVIPTCTERDANRVETALLRAADRCQEADDRRSIVRAVNAHEALVRVLEQGIEESGFSLSGPTDLRAAEHGEPPWVCNARAALTLARNGGE